MLFIYLKQKHLNFVPTEGRDVTSLEHMPISLDCKCCLKGHSCLVTWKWRKWTVLDCILLCLGCEIVHYCSFEVVVHCSCGWFYDSKNIKLFARMYWRQWLICLCSGYRCWHDAFYSVGFIVSWQLIIHWWRQCQRLVHVCNSYTTAVLTWQETRLLHFLCYIMFI